MEVKRVDVAVIGAGTAGLAARRAAVAAGASVAIIESGAYGTTCARVGCMPSKLLIAAADAAHEVAHAGRFGVRVPDGVRIDGAAVLARVRRERDRFVGLVAEGVAAIPAAERIRGRARFVAPGVLAVDEHTRIEARAVVVATGSKPTLPPPLLAAGAPVLTNESIFELPDLPRSLAVVGSGVVGLELGQALHRLGVRTVCFSHSDRLGPFTDPELQRRAAALLGRELTLHQPVEIAVGRDGEQFAIAWRDQAGDHEVRVDAVLAAAGRHPDVADLQLARAGVPFDSFGRPLFDPHTMQCGTAPVFLAGDVSDDRPVLHEAADAGHIAGANAAAWPNVRPRPRRAPLMIAFTDPTMALVGTPWAALDAAQVEVGAIDYADQGRARVMGRNAGLVRIYARRACGTLLGAEMLGPRVEHTAHLLAWAVQSGLTVEQALAMPFYHPVIEEGIRSALRDLWARVERRPPPPPAPHDLECGPGT
ncbi:dihydrolipoyl dehydrogenase [bacterium]|nr:dihydrolipoyl dehydrogenase [bacterium]